MSKSWLEYVEIAEENINEIINPDENNKPCSIDYDLIRIQKAITALKWALKCRNGDE